VAEEIRRFGKGRHAAVVSTITGDDNLQFFRELSRQGVGAAQIPVMSLSIGEAELPALMRSNMAGHFVAWNYLHAFDRKENRDFIAGWRRFTGQPRAVTNDPMEATWIGFHLWTEAVEAAGSTDTDKGARRARRPPDRRPERLHGEDGHPHPSPVKPVMIGRIGKDGSIATVSVTEGLVPPEPFSPWLTPGRAAA